MAHLLCNTSQLVLCGPGLEGSGPRKRLSRALSPQAGPAQAGLGLGPGFVGAAEDRNWYFENDINELH